LKKVLTMNSRVEDSATHDDIELWSDARRAQFERLNAQAPFSFNLPGEMFWKRHIIDPYEQPSILDAGCGSGAFLRLLGHFLRVKHNKVATLLGVDKTPDFLDWADKIIEPAGIIPSYRPGNFLETECFGGQQFDVVHISATILGAGPSLSESFTKVQQILKPGGPLIIQEPNLDDFKIFPPRDQYEMQVRWEELIRRMQENCVAMWGVPQSGDILPKILEGLGFADVRNHKAWIPSSGSLYSGCGFFNSLNTFLPETERSVARLLIEEAEQSHAFGRRSRSYVTATKS
jgi:SAM-dependent methyltransferase